MLASSLIVIGANKGGVGKTTLARLLIDYFEILRSDIKVFDTQSPTGALKRFYPEAAEVIDMANTRDRCRVVESLDAPGRITIVDLRAGSLTESLEFFRAVGLFDAVSAREIKLLVLHLVGSSVASLAEVQDLAPFHEACDFRIVRNLANGSTFLRDDHRLSQAFLSEEVRRDEIIIPCLDPLAYEAVDLTALPFSSFVLDEPSRGAEQLPRSFVLRGYVKTWLERAWDNFESAGLDRYVEAAPAAAVGRAGAM